MSLAYVLVECCCSPSSHQQHLTCLVVGDTRHCFGGGNVSVHITMNWLAQQHDNAADPLGALAFAICDQRPCANTSCKAVRGRNAMQLACQRHGKCYFILLLNCKQILNIFRLYQPCLATAYMPAFIHAAALAALSVYNTEVAGIRLSLVCTAFLGIQCCSQTCLGFGPAGRHVQRARY